MGPEVTVAIAWLTIAIALVSLELTTRRTASLPGLRSAYERVTSRRAGRLALLACWAFVGWHLFARYTVPHL